MSCWRPSPRTAPWVSSNEGDNLKAVGWSLRVASLPALNVRQLGEAVVTI